MKKLILAAALLTVALTCAWAEDKAAAQGAAPHWSYTGPTGAIKWGELQKDFAT